MQKQNAFSLCHPLVSFLYFALVLFFSMFFMHPACLIISLACAIGYSAFLTAGKASSFSFRFVLPMALLAAVVNPAFNHQGATILCYLPSGNPLTAQSIFYGLASSAMLAAVILWFVCFTEIVSSDKFVYLFGRIVPALSLILSMTLRFVPAFVRQMRQVSDARRCMHGGEKETSLPARVKGAAAVFSATVTWSLENAVETADSMKARGYGLPGRTAFSIYRLEGRDRFLLRWLALCGVYVFLGWSRGAFDFRYYPAVHAAELSAFSLSFYLAYFALCLTPLVLDGMEERKWKQLRSGT